MAHVDWDRVQAVFDEVADATPAERTRLLEEHPAEVRAEVEALLATTDGGDAMRAAIARGITALASAGEVGDHIGPYRLIARIGEGGMGVVYRGERADGEYHAVVAIKVLRAGYVGTALRARFRDERQFLAALEHPGIVRLLDAGSTPEGVPYLVMEHVDGTSLVEHARSLQIRARVELLTRIARTVQYAHQHLIVHRDLKPSNVLVTREGEPKLLDFGIAKLVAPVAGFEREAETRTGLALLTPSYASPEQVRGEPVSVATDVYSLGAVLYELLADRPPHQTAGVGDPLETLRAICEVDPPRPGVVTGRRELAGDLDNIVMRALRKHPGERYASAAALADDLERYLTGMPVEARPPTLAYRLKKLLARHKLLASVIALAVLGLATVTALVFVQARRADREARAAEQQNRALLESQGWQELERGDYTRALPYLVEALRWDDTSATRYLIARALAPFERRRAFADYRQHGLTRVLATPDFRQFIALGPEGARAYDERGSPTGFRVSGARHWAATISRAGELVMTSVDRRSVEIYDLATSTLRQTIATPFPEIESVGLMPDERHLVIGTLQGRFATCDRDTRTCQPRPGLGLFVIGETAIATADGDTIVVRGADWEPVDTIRLGRGTTITNLAYASPDRLAVGIGSQLVIVDPRTHAIVAEHAGQSALAVGSPDGKHLATLGADRALHIWDLRTGRHETAITGFGSLRAVIWSPDSTRIATTGSDNFFRLWSARDGRAELALVAVAPSGRTAGTMGQAFAATVTGDGKRLVTASATEVAWWDLERPSGRELAVRGGLFAASPSPDERLVATSGRDGHLGLYEVGRPDAIWQRRVGEELLYDLQWSPDGRTFALAGTGATARVVRRDGTVAHELVGHVGPVHRAAVSPDGTTIATAGADHTTRLWSAATGELRVALPAFDRVMSTSWRPDGRVLVAAAWNGRVTFTDPATLTTLATIATDRSLLDAAVSPDGTRLATAAHGGEIELWDVASGRRIGSCEGHTGPATMVAWSPDGELLASSGDDGTARMWDPRTCRRLETFVLDQPTMQVMWNREGTRLWITGHAGKVVVRDVVRETRSLAELEHLVAEGPWRLVDGRLQLR